MQTFIRQTKSVGGSDNLLEGGLWKQNVYKESSSELPLLTVITVVLNRRKHISKAIQSVTNQSYENIEYIIIDGGSTDGTLQIIQQNDNLIDYWVSERDSGLYHAMNKGLNLARGEIIGLLNSDDYYPRTTVQSVIDHDKKFNKDIYHGDRLYIMEYDDFCYMEQSMPDPDINNILNKPSIFHPTCFVKKSVYEKIGQFDTDFRIVADYDFLIRAVKNGCSFKYIERVLTVFNGTGISDSCYRHIESLRLFKKHNRYDYHKMVIAFIRCCLIKISSKIIRYDNFLRKKRKSSY